MTFSPELFFICISVWQDIAREAGNEQGRHFAQGHKKETVVGHGLWEIGGRHNTLTFPISLCLQTKWHAMFSWHEWWPFKGCIRKWWTGNALVLYAGCQLAERICKLVPGSPRLHFYILHWKNTHLYMEELWELPLQTRPHKPGKVVCKSLKLQC